MNLYNQISKIGKKYGADKIVLYGSRARGDNRERSDIDIAVFGLSESKQGAFSAEIEELPTLLDFDIAFISKSTSQALLKNIEKDGKIIMSKFEEKAEKFTSAVARLEEAVAEYKEFGISTARDGVIQRFEICTELAWKTTREYLLDQGYTEINSPKSVMKQAYADGIIDNEEEWLNVLNARNLSSHLYDEETASDIYTDIESKYISLFKELLQKLK